MSIAVELEEKLSNATCLNDCLLILLSMLQPYGVRDIVYGYILHKFSAVRNDGILLSTLSDSLMLVYAQNGNMSTDPVAYKVTQMREPNFISFKALYHDRSAGFYYKNKFVKALIDEGYGLAISIPPVDMDPVGYTAITFYENGNEGKLQTHLDNLKPVPTLFHNFIKKRGLMKGYFDINREEIELLKMLGSGKRIENIALDTNFSIRTIDLKLRHIRKKLNARTTAEATYKAVSYGVFNKETDQ